MCVERERKRERKREERERGGGETARAEGKREWRDR